MTPRCFLAIALTLSLTACEDATAPGTGGVIGQVLAADGSPIAGAEIEALQRTERAVSDGSGNFALGAVGLAGTFVFKFSADGFATIYVQRVLAGDAPHFIAAKLPRVHFQTVTMPATGD